MTSDIHHYDNGKPLNRSESIKRQLERDAAKHFLRLYEQAYGVSMRDIWHNEPSKPDISCHLEGRPLDLEIAHLYASKSEAKILSNELIEEIGNSNESLDPSEKELELIHYLSDLVEMDSQKCLSTALVRLLRSKAKKHYDSPRAWLVIRNASPLWQADDFKRCIAHFHMPENPFEQIWLLPEFDGSQLPIQIC